MKATNCRFCRFFGKKDARNASDPKSPVRKIRMPGSVAGRLGNQPSYADGRNYRSGSSKDIKESAPARQAARRVRLKEKRNVK